MIEQVNVENTFVLRFPPRGVLFDCARTQTLVTYFFCSFTLPCNCMLLRHHMIADDDEKVYIYMCQCGAVIPRHLAGRESKIYSPPSHSCLHISLNYHVFFSLFFLFLTSPFICVRDFGVFFIGKKKDFLCCYNTVHYYRTLGKVMLLFYLRLFEN